MRSLQAEIVAEGHRISLNTLCGWLGVPRRSLYYKPKRRPRLLDTELTERVRLSMQRFPTYGYRRLAVVLGENKKPIQRILQIKGWQVRKRPLGFSPRAKALPSVAQRPDKRWATDLCHIWCGRDRRCALATVIDCCTREILGWRLSVTGANETAEAALEEALIHRLGHLQRLKKLLLLRSDNGLVFSSKRYTETVNAYGLTQEFFTPYNPEQNGLMERFFRSLKEECIWQNQLESLAHARRVISQWVRFYNTGQPHQSLGYVAPIAHPALVA